MRKPNFSKPRSAMRGFSLSRTLPPLRLPRSSAHATPPRAHPQVGRPAGRAGAAAAVAPCGRCGHGQDSHPVRYVCDKYPHPDPLQICGCEAASISETCAACGHTARHHKPRHRCRDAACSCWGYVSE